MSGLKMYIAVLDIYPAHMVPVLVSHTILNAHIKFQNDPTYELWLKESFKKCVVKVNSSQFGKIAELQNVCIGHEKSTLEGIDGCVIVMPREVIPNVLKFAPLWKP